MNLNQEQIELFKKQIIQQIENSFSEEKKGPAIERIKEMDSEEFIEFLKKNKLLEEGENQENIDKTGKETSPFRLIIEKKIPFYQIAENKEALAVLEIRPISKGHSIIIPKKTLTKLDKIPKSILSLAKKVSKKIKDKFKPKEVLVLSSILFEEIIINLLPVYTNETLDSQRKEASQEELEELKKSLEKKARTSIKKEVKPKLKSIEGEKLWLPKRIP